MCPFVFFLFFLDLMNKLFAPAIRLGFHQKKIAFVTQTSVFVHVICRLGKLLFFLMLPPDLIHCSVCPTHKNKENSRYSLCNGTLLCRN